MKTMKLLALALLGIVATAEAQATPPKADSSIYLVYFWRARPGKIAEYSEYIRTIAEPIDENARQAGVFLEVTTFTPWLTTGAPGTDWTHMRVFKLKNFAALDAFSKGMDDAGKRVFPEEQRRKDNSARSAELRDLVRQEIWRRF